MPNYLRRGATDLDAAGGGSPLGARVVISTNGAAASGTWDAFSFDTEIFDSGGFWDPAAPNRFTITDAGLYLLGGAIDWNAATDLGRRFQEFRDGSGTVLLGEVYSALGYSTRFVMSGAVSLAAGSYVQFWRMQNSGGSLGIQAQAGSPSMWITRLA